MTEMERVNPETGEGTSDGLLLPCNVIVYETSPESSVVAAMAPLAALGIVGDNPALADVAREADQRLRAALAELEKK